ncbi:N-acyl homoserine lactonase family protein [Micromonospora maris]|uniref:N-acyl homoserine lactonase family protein n=1 Tax=Micromonospora maris TaxID=1003110 RepID=UPI002E14DB69|nr:N-acyl homoserine lactonase family protein [Micromonospora maris]
MKSSITSVHLLDGGVLDVESSVVVPGSGFGRRIAVPVQMFLVGTTSGYVLVDTGNDPGVIDDPVATWGADLAAASRPRMQPHQHPARQLALLGLAPRDVRAVVYTHLHHDHAGGGRVFPHAVHVVQRAEHRWATSPDGHAGTAYVPADFTATTWTLADGDWHMLPGLQLMMTPGHTPGHQSVVLWDVPDLGNVILAGDAINTVGCIDDGLPPGIATDTLAAVHSMHRLTALADATDALVVTGHDMTQFEALPKAPDPLRRPTGGPVHQARKMLDLR